MTKWNADIQYPSDNCFENRILSIKAEPSNSGNPQIVMETEVVAPTMYEIAGEEVNIQDVKVTMYQAYTVMDGEEIDKDKTDKARARCLDLLKNLEAVEQSATVSDVSWDNLGPVLAPLKGKIILTQMSSRVTPQLKTPTAAQIATAKAAGKRPEGDVMKHPKTGKDLIKYWPQIVDVYGLRAE